jgi:hypothetical protein
MQEICKRSFLNSAGVLIYITLVSLVLQNGERIFGEMDNFIGPVAFLLLFTLSAAIVGSLILGKPILMYLDGKKKEAVQLLMASIGWLALYFLIALIVSAIF